MVAYMDTLVGRLVSGIDHLGLRDNTLILYYSDNGTDARITSRLNGAVVRGGKAQPTQTGIRVPLIANCPGKISPTVNSDLIDASDFLPTLAELAAGSVPTGWFTDGRSFEPTLYGKA